MKFKQVSLYVIVRAHCLELDSKAFTQRNEMKNEKDKFRGLQLCNLISMYLYDRWGQVT